MPLSLTRKIVYSAIVTVSALLFLEGLARLAYRGRPAGSGRAAPLPYPFFSPSPTLGWRWRPGYEGEIFEAEVLETRRCFDDRGRLCEDSADGRDTTRKLVLFTGDSNTFGIFVPAASTFVEVVDSSRTDVEAINLAVPGYTSHQGLQTLLALPGDIQPDAVVVAFNFNDRRSVSRARGPDSPRALQAICEKSGLSGRQPELALLDQWYSLRLLRMVLARAAIGVGRPLNTALVGVDTLEVRVPPSEFRRNLETMVAWARRRNAGLLFVKLDDNPKQTEWLRRGKEFLTSSRLDSARIALERAVSEDNIYSDLARIHLARVYRKLNRMDEARRIVAVRRDVFPVMGDRPLYLDSEYHEIMREVAARNGVPVVDAGSELAADGAYVDFCHFDARGHARIAAALIDSLSAVLNHKEKPAVDYPAGSVRFRSSASRPSS
jgi:lysophospholipase L1-like esterase